MTFDVSIKCLSGKNVQNIKIIVLSIKINQNQEKWVQKRKLWRKTAQPSRQTWDLCATERLQPIQNGQTRLVLHFFKNQV